jgi:hypothetical protein
MAGKIVAGAASQPALKSPMYKGERAHLPMSLDSSRRNRANTV